jgi:hypothetical protein
MIWDRFTRAVDEASWVVADVLPPARRTRLMNPPACDDLLRRLIGEANAAALSGCIHLDWKECEDHPGEFAQVVARVPLTEETFDQLFNGRSGYRAQYYLSPEEGVLFNRDILEGLVTAVSDAYSRKRINVSFELIEKSMRAPHAKMWIFDECLAFDQALPDTLNPPRWVSNGATRGRKAPLPDHLTIEIKGSLIRCRGEGIYVNEMKLDRPLDLFSKGYT